MLPHTTAPARRHYRRPPGTTSSTWLSEKAHKAAYSGPLQPHAVRTRCSRHSGRSRAHRPRQVAGMGTAGIQDRQAPSVKRPRRARVDWSPGRV